MLLATLFVLCNLELHMQNSKQWPKQPENDRPKIEVEDRIEVKVEAKTKAEASPTPKLAAKATPGKASGRSRSRPVTQSNGNRNTIANFEPEIPPVKEAVQPEAIKNLRSTYYSPVRRAPESAPEIRSAVTRSSLSAMPLSWSLRAPDLNELRPGPEEVISDFLDQKQELRPWKWRAALSQDEAALRKQPGNKYVKARMLFLLGRLAYLQGDSATALAKFNEAARVSPNSFLGYLGAGSVHLANHSSSEAIKCFQRVIRIKPNLSVAYKWLGDAYYSSQRNKDAVKMYERALALGYNGPGLGAALDKIQIQSLISERRWEQSLFKLQSMAELAPSADIYLIIGHCHEELNQTISAAQAYEKAVELEPQSAIAHYRLGNLLLQQREYKMASDEIERAIALDPWGAKIDLQQARKKMQEITGKNGR